MMKRNVLSRVASTLFVAVLLVAALAVAVSAAEETTAPTEHVHTLTKGRGHDATCEEPGFKDCWICTGCGQLFEDENGKTPTSWDGITIPAKKHIIVKGRGHEPRCEVPGYEDCWVCSECGQLFKDENGNEKQTWDAITTPATGHKTEKVERVEPTCEKAGNIEHWRCTACGKLFADEKATQELSESDVVLAAQHTVVIDPPVAPTCGKDGLTAGSHCAVCGKILDPQEVVPTTVNHTFDDGKVVAPTCCHEGYTVYTCRVCGTQVITDKVKPISHWYAEWKPTGEDQNSAPCKRNGCTFIKTTDCIDWDFMLFVDDAEETEEAKEAEEFTVCPVCGRLSDGGRLELVEKAKATPITGWTPEGDLVLRYGELENGEKIICVGFEFDARLVQCTGRTKFTVPAELLEDYKLMLLDDEGVETELEVETKGKNATFTLDFDTLDDNGRRIPVRMLHLVPIEEPEVTAG